jgi:hypothetical protein
MTREKNDPQGATFPIRLTLPCYSSTSSTTSSLRAVKHLPDAHMRDYFLVIPSDCVESETDERKHHALQILGEVLDADTTPAAGLNLKALLAGRTSKLPTL